MSANLLVDQILSLGVIFLQVGIVLILISKLYPKKTQGLLISLIKKFALKFSFIIALASMAGSLYYSEIRGFTPCNLCWYQRIFMYPLVFILAMAIYKKDNKIADYGILLSAIGALIAGYQYLLQLGIAPKITCSAAGLSVSCANKIISQFGYITFPMMSLTAFLAIAILLSVLKITSKKK
ncbi:disulfide bond formation protein B [Candidatus Daviesbacteria bacterium]|nr:disulfide bond formation protein B [Candidatus Daviesbacteria bacterium]